MKAMRQMMAVMLMGLAFSAAQVESSAQSRSKNDRKPAATTNHSKPAARPVRPDVKPGGQSSRPSGPATKPSGPATRPSGPATKPSGPTTRPSGPATRPSGPATKPGGPSNRPSGPATKPSGPVNKPSGPAARPNRPTTRPPAPKPVYGPGHKPGYRPAPRPPKRAPRPVIVVRPTYGTIITATIASQLVRSAVRAASRPIYITVESRGLSLSHSYISSGTEYYYQDGVFYIIDAYGQYITIIPPTGALVEYLPDDYVRFTRGGETYYRVDDTVYALTLIDGNPYFEVLGQM
jgi:hypothetical protein